MSFKLTKELFKSWGFDEDRYPIFIAYHKKNPKAWKYFELITLISKNKGEDRQANDIREQVRKSFKKATRKDFGFDNNHTPVYARIFNKKHNTNYFNCRGIKPQITEQKKSSVEQQRAENLSLWDRTLPSSNTYFKRKAA